MTTPEMMLVGVAITNALAVGAAWANLKSDHRQTKAEIAAIKELLGNGEPGVFVRRAELALMRDEARREHGVFEHRLDRIEGE